MNVKSFIPFLQKFAAEKTVQMKQILVEKNMSDSKTIQKTTFFNIETTNKQDKDYIKLTIEVPKDSKLNYIDGRGPGTPPPTNAIAKFCMKKGISIKYSFPIAISIGKKGTLNWNKPPSFFSPLKRGKDNIKGQLIELTKKYTKEKVKSEFVKYLKQGTVTTNF